METYPATQELLASETGTTTGQLLGAALGGAAILGGGLGLWNYIQKERQAAHDRLVNDMSKKVTLNVANARAAGYNAAIDDAGKANNQASGRTNDLETRLEALTSVVERLVDPKAPAKAEPKEAPTPKKEGAPLTAIDQIVEMLQKQSERLEALEKAHQEA